MAEDASSKKFLVSNFINFKMTNSRPVMEQYNDILDILGRFTQHKINMDEAIQVSCIINKLHPSWKDFKYTLKHQKDELTLVELGSHMHIEESPKVQDNDKPKGNNVVGPSVVNMVNHNNSFKKCGKPEHLKKDCKGGKVGNKANGPGINGSVDGSTNPLKGATMHSVGIIHEMTAPYTPQQNGISKRKNRVLKEMVNSMLSYSRLSQEFCGEAMFYVTEPNESVSINSIIESKDAIFDENIFSSVPRPSLRIPNETEDIGGSMVPEKVTEVKILNNSIQLGSCNAWFTSWGSSCDKKTCKQTQF
ncbi:zinc finger, CCHC-type containing protein [Tanacetum coccineum]